MPPQATKPDPVSKNQNGNNQVITIDNDVDLTNLSYMSKKQQTGTKSQVYQTNYPSYARNI